MREFGHRSWGERFRKTENGMRFRVSIQMSYLYFSNNLKIKKHGPNGLARLESDWPASYCGLGQTTRVLFKSSFFEPNTPNFQANPL